ncbi:preprotein translocase subunit YajC [Clostridium fermenticellae]|uniref:Preprotein translocase subunit YajC n=1 Tax=Clostridium fermenticellae TaxID=2068654 RepID=A0A386H2F7_9CLOT|nr:preprotein translocase subunit YajC [Clostridium fermenticellae]AYD39846.1 preprotein translocase subunit YajC [Clostridium fermenticellae]
MKTLIQFSPIILMLILCYILILVPENKRKKKYNTMLEALKVNDEVITKGGIIGKITNIQGKAVIIQTGPDKIKIKIDKTGILDLMTDFDSHVSEKDKKENKN